MFCSSCGNHNTGGAKFCTFCGGAMGQAITRSNPQYAEPCPYQNNAPGKGCLKAASVFLLITGILGLVGLLVMMGDGYGTRMRTDMEYQYGVSWGWIAITSVVTTIMCLEFGIKGLIYCDNSDKAKNLLARGIGMLVWDILTVITIPKMMVSSGMDFLLVLLGIGVTVLYIIGAAKNKKDDIPYIPIYKSKFIENNASCALCDKAYNNSLSSCPHCGHRPGTL